MNSALNVSWPERLRRAWVVKGEVEEKWKVVVQSPATEATTGVEPCVGLRVRHR